LLRLAALFCQSNLDRIQAVREAELQRERYRELFEFAPDSYLVTDLNGVIGEANRAACDLLNLPRRFLVGTLLVSYVRKEEHRAFLGRLADLPRLEVTQEWEMTLLPVRCSPAEVAAKVMVCRDRTGAPATLRWLLHNVTPWKRALAAVRAQKSFSEGMVDSAAVLVLVLDGDGRVLRVNPFFEAVAGYRAADLRDRDWPETLGVQPAEAPARLMAEALGRAGGGRALFSILTQSGQRRRVEWSARPLRYGSAAAPAVLLIGHDVTEFWEAQEEKVRVERLAAIGEMVAGLAHESRNALQRSQACLERLRWQLQDRPQALGLVARLQAAQDDLLRLYEDVRGYAAPIRIDPRPCDLAPVWRQAWESLAAVRRDRDAELAEEPGTDDRVCPGDCFRLAQVFRNAFENSLAACADPVRLTVACRADELDGRPALTVAVRDNGPGLTAEQRQRIFEPFYSTKTHGSGLGMTIARRIVEAHGGRLAAGEPEAGTEILLTLPRGGKRTSRLGPPVVPPPFDTLTP
jgi:PAS domain S-box-containing protein